MAENNGKPIVACVDDSGAARRTLAWAERCFHRGDWSATVIASAVPGVRVVMPSAR